MCHDGIWHLRSWKNLHYRGELNKNEKQRLAPILEKAAERSYTLLQGSKGDPGVLPRTLTTLFTVCGIPSDSHMTSSWIQTFSHLLRAAALVRYALWTAMTFVH